MKILSFVLALFLPTLGTAFQSAGVAQRSPSHKQVVELASSKSMNVMEETNDGTPTSNRRDMIRNSVLSFCAWGVGTSIPSPVWAATRAPLGDLLYILLRVREATEQESRLIKTGKFKDIQRANIKLAVKFMVENYRLADTFVSASAYLEGTDKRVSAGQVGQNAVQNLQTILEYFDSSDVQNLKVGSDSLAGKEQLVLKGLDATRRNLDDFLSYFPAGEIDAAKQKILAENALNEKEFDPELGFILNLKPTQQYP